MKGRWIKCWPEGKRATLAVSFDLDGETLWSGEPDNLEFNLSQGRYGPQCGLPLILDALEELNVRATFFVTGWVIDQYPEAAAKIVEAGHEIGSHGYHHRRASDLDRVEEAEEIQRSYSAIKEQIGPPPRGYRAPYWDLGHHTMDLVSASGFVYTSNLMDSLIPYYHRARQGTTPILEIPSHWISVDAPFFWYPKRNLLPAQLALDAWRDEMDALRECGGLLTLVCHPQVIGRPSRVRMLSEFLRWVHTLGDVWVTALSPLADYWRSRFPYEG